MYIFLKKLVWVGCGGRDVDLYEVEASLVVYIISSRLARLHNRTLSHINNIRNLICKLAQFLGLFPCVLPVMSPLHELKHQALGFKLCMCPHSCESNITCLKLPTLLSVLQCPKSLGGGLGSRMRYLPANSWSSPWNPNSSQDYSLHNIPRSLMGLNKP